jgi:hypothetical protein
MLKLSFSLPSTSTPVDFLTRPGAQVTICNSLGLLPSGTRQPPKQPLLCATHSHRGRPHWQTCSKHFLAARGPCIFWATLDVASCPQSSQQQASALVSAPRPQHPQGILLSPLGGKPVRLTGFHGPALCHLRRASRSIIVRSYHSRRGEVALPRAEYLVRSHGTGWVNQAALEVIARKRVSHVPVHAFLFLWICKDRGDVLLQSLPAPWMMCAFLQPFKYLEDSFVAPLAHTPHT